MSMNNLVTVCAETVVALVAVHLRRLVAVTAGRRRGGLTVLHGLLKPLVGREHSSYRGMPGPISAVRAAQLLAALQKKREQQVLELAPSGSGPHARQATWEGRSQATWAHLVPQVQDAGAAQHVATPQYTGQELPSIIKV